jgi:F-type H+-transporting ATPase subunit b
MIHVAGLIAEAAPVEHNPLLPEISDLVWGTLTFVIILVFFFKYVMPRFRKVLEERSQKIEGGIQHAEQMQDEAALLLSQYRAQIGDARGEAANIRKSAEHDKAAIIDEARKDAEQVRKHVVDTAHTQIDADRAKAVNEVSREGGDLAISLAERIVGVTLADDARAREVIDRFIAELESAAPAPGQGA